jgi:hypothetical protein
MHACRMGLEGSLVEAALRALPIGPVAGLAQGEERGRPGDDQGAGSGVVKLVTDGLGYRPDIEHQFSLWRERRN